MIYYRFAFKDNQLQPWQWYSTFLTSFSALFVYLRAYSMVPQDRLCIFFSSSKEAMETMLIRQNAGLVSCSLTPEQLLTSKNLILHMRRLELEISTCGDHDLPYLFTAPSQIDILIWTKLKARVHSGELVP
jgi:hypothetical protein